MNPPQGEAGHCGFCLLILYLRRWKLKHLVVKIIAFIPPVAARLSQNHQRSKTDKTKASPLSEDPPKKSWDPGPSPLFPMVKPGAARESPPNHRHCNSCRVSGRKTLHIFLPDLVSLVLHSPMMQKTYNQFLIHSKGNLSIKYC